MTRKPSQTYGHIAFSKSGKVTRQVYTLSNVKRKQEDQIAKIFCEQLPREQFGKVEWAPLAEDDHGFRLVSDKLCAEMQITELSPYEYMKPLTNEEWLEGTSGFDHFAQGEGGKMFGIDTTKRDSLIVERIRLKQGKHYPRPKEGELWLCIFSNDAFVVPYAYQGGKRIKSKAMELAEVHCQSTGIAPFDSVWFLFLSGRPYRIWPPEDP